MISSFDPKNKLTNLKATIHMIKKANVLSHNHDSIWFTLGLAYNYLKEFKKSMLIIS